MLSSLIHLSCILFRVRGKKLVSFSCNYLVLAALYVEDDHFPLFYIIGFFAKNSGDFRIVGLTVGPEV